VAVADLVVKSDAQLDTFLRSNGVQQWRVPILAANGGIVVMRGKGGPRVSLPGASTLLQAKDTVRLVSPLPKACVAALQKEADQNWRDYAIAPGVDAKGAPPFNERMRKFLTVRTNTILIDTKANPSMENLQGFLQGIATSELMTHPIRDLIVAGHASGVSGSFRISLTPGSDANVVTYELLEQAVKQRSLLVNVGLMLPRPKGANPPRMRLFGCAVGRAAPFMRKLKEALGNQMLVTAPNHLLIGGEISPRKGRGKSFFTGELAYMAYAFRLYLLPPETPRGKKRPVRTKKDIVDAFVAATTAEADKAKAQKLTPDQLNASMPSPHMLQDRTYVTKAQWNEWVPANPEEKRWFPPDPFRPAPDRHQIRNMVRLPVLPVPVFPAQSDAPRQFQNHLAHSWFEKPLTMPLTTDPGDDAGRKKAAKGWLQRDARYSDKHPYPEYVRAGYATIDEFMDGWDWQFDYDAKQKQLTFNPTRDEYAVVQPVTNKARVLMLNLYTQGPPPKQFAKELPLEMLLIDDRFFFATY
jgi:hypothetical protein